MGKVSAYMILGVCLATVAVIFVASQSYKYTLQTQQEPDSVGQQEEGLPRWSIALRDWSFNLWKEGDQECQVCSIDAKDCQVNSEATMHSHETFKCSLFA